jgi:hypothetical protein
MSQPQQPRVAEAATVLAMVKAQEAARAAAEAQAVALARMAASTFTAWYDSAAITEWAATLARQVEAVLRTSGRTTDSYLARMVSLLTGQRFRPAGVADLTQLRGPELTGAGAFARAADAFRWQQAQQDRAARALLTQPSPRVPNLQTPVAAAVGRAVEVAEQGVQLTQREQTVRTLGRAEAAGLVTGYRRIIHPELAKSGTTCGLCVAAADRVYKVSELLPIHNGCNCTVAPMTAELDPGLNLNQMDLRRLYKAAGSTGAADLSAVRYKIHDHGELGPQLVIADAPVRTERRAKADKNRPRPAKTPEQRRADLERVRAGLVPAAAKAREMAAEQPDRWSSYAASVEARIADLDRQLAA